MLLVIIIVSACSLLATMTAARLGFLGRRRFDIAADAVNPDTNDDYTSDIYVRSTPFADVVYRDLMYNGFPRAPMRAVDVSLRPVDLYVNGRPLSIKAATVRVPPDAVSL